MCLESLAGEAADPDPGGLDGAWASVFLTSYQVMPRLLVPGQSSRAIHLKCCESPAGLIRKAESYPLPTLCPDLLTQNLCPHQMARWWQTCSVWGLLPGTSTSSRLGPHPPSLEGQVLSRSSLALAYELGYSSLFSGNNPLPDLFPLPPLDSLLLHGQNSSVLSLMSPPSTTHACPYFIISCFCTCVADRNWL